MAHLCPGELPQLADLANSRTARRHSWADLGGTCSGSSSYMHSSSLGIAVIVELGAEVAVHGQPQQWTTILDRPQQP